MPTFVIIMQHGKIATRGKRVRVRFYFVMGIYLHMYILTVSRKSGGEGTANTGLSLTLGLARAADDTFARFV